MKVLIAIPSVAAIYGGPSKCVIELATELGRLGINVDLITTNADGNSSLDVPLNKWISQSSYRMRYFSYYKRSAYLFSYALTRWILQNVRSYDIVHTNAVFSYPVLATCYACKMNDVPYVVTPHGMLEPWALSQKATKKRIYYQISEKTLLKKAAAIHALARPEAANIKSLQLGAPIFLGPNGIHRPEFETLPNRAIFFEEYPQLKGKKLVLFLSRIDPKKGLDILAKAFGILVKQYNNLHLIVAGPDNIGFLQTARQFFQDHECLDKVTFTGILTGKLKYAALAAASVYVLPSYSEGFSVSVLEAMASGLPSVITRACNFPEAERAQVVKAVDTNTEQLTDALNWCVKNEAEATFMGKRAQKFVFEYYTWDKIASHQIGVYETILKKEELSPFSL